jgi:hypothetical protein
MVEDILNEEAEYIENLNKEQLEFGKRADNTNMPEYAPITIKWKQQFGGGIKGGGLISLYDSGDFWGAFWAKAYNNQLNMWSDDFKTQELVSRYGEQIFGLNDENFNALGNVLADKLKIRIGQYLQQ